MQLTKSQAAASLGAVAIVVGSFMDWAKVEAFLGSVSVSGFDAGDGKITAGLGAVAVVLFVFVANRPAAVGGAFFAGAAGAVGVYDYSNVAKKLGDVNDTGFAHASVGVGLYLVIGGGAVSIVAGLAWRKEAPTLEQEATVKPQQSAPPPPPPLAPGSPLPPPPPPA